MGDLVSSGISRRLEPAVQFALGKKNNFYQLARPLSTEALKMEEWKWEHGD
jgi:hypothetical protein